MILNSSAPLNTPPTLRRAVLLRGVDSALLLELSELSSLELISLSLLEDSDESRDFFPAAFRACRLACFLAFFSRGFCFSLSARASSLRYCLPHLSILMMIS